MQYLLSEHEYRELVEAKKREAKAIQYTFQHLCSRVANSELVKVNHWDKEIPKEKQKPWGCKIDDSGRKAAYCDLCPVLEICPFENKTFSK